MVKFIDIMKAIPTYALSATGQLIETKNATWFPRSEVKALVTRADDTVDLLSERLRVVRDELRAVYESQQKLFEALQAEISKRNAAELATRHANETLEIARSRNAVLRDELASVESKAIGFAAKLDERHNEFNQMRTALRQQIDARTIVQAKLDEVNASIARNDVEQLKTAVRAELERLIPPSLPTDAVYVVGFFDANNYTHYVTRVGAGYAYTPDKDKAMRVTRTWAENYTKSADNRFINFA